MYTHKYTNKVFATSFCVTGHIHLRDTTNTLD